MLKRTKKVLCVILSLCMVFSTLVFAFADDTTEPVIMVNDLSYNPLVNLETGEDAFSFTEVEKKLPFTSGIPTAFYDELDMESIEKLVSGKMTASEMLSFIGDALGYTEDISTISTSVINLAMELLSKVNIDITSGDIMKMLSGLDVNALVQFFIDKIFEPITHFKSIVLNEDGTSVDENVTIAEIEGSYDDMGSFDQSIYCSPVTAKIAEKVGYTNLYTFNYDFRLDPLVNAEKFSEYVQYVKNETGSDKVKIVAEGYGTVIAMTYLSVYKDTASENVSDYISISSAFEGTTLAGNLFAGKVKSDKYSFNSNYVTSFFRYLNDMSDNPVTALAMFITTYAIDKEVTTHKVDIVKNLDKFKSLIYSAFVNMKIQKTAVTMPGLWALVPVDMYDDAVINVYGEEPTNEEYLDKLQAYKDLQSDGEDTLIELKDSGVNISVVAAWDMQMMPLGNKMNMQSNGLIDTMYASFGATCIDIDEIGQASKAKQEINDGHNHLSLGYDKIDLKHRFAGICRYIDASTCALPENTWFVKNMKHGSYQENSNFCDFVVWLISGERTVFDAVGYGQFLSYNRYVKPGEITQSGLKSPTNPRKGKFMLGDADLNERVNINDVSVAQQISKELIEVDEKSVTHINADMDLDTFVDDDDANKIMDIASGLTPDMTSGIDLEYRTEPGLLEDSPCEITLEPTYNSTEDTLTVEFGLTNADCVRAATFIINYDEKALTLEKTITPELNENVLYREGKIENLDNTRTVAISSADEISLENTDENGNLMLVKYVFTLKNYTDDITFSVGSTKLYIGENDTYAESVSKTVDSDMLFIYGDWNNDRDITAADARGILRISAKLEKCKDDAMFKRCDVDQDGRITPKDARQVLRVSAKLQNGYVLAK